MSQVEAKQQHTLVAVSFRRPSHCSVCDKLIYGLKLSKGFKCTACKTFRCHKKCSTGISCSCECGERRANGHDELLDATKTLAELVIRGATVSDEVDHDFFLNAIMRKDLKMTSYVLDKYIATQSKDINIQDRVGNTPLHYMIMNQLDANVIKHALRSPVIRCNIANSDGNTPLHLLCHKANSAAHVEIGELLIFSPTDTNRQNLIGETPMHKALYNYAMRDALVQMLMRNNADLNVCTNLGETVLHYAAKLNAIDLVKRLLIGGARETFQRGRLSPSQEAHELGYVDLARIIKRAHEICVFLSHLGLSLYETVFIAEELKGVSTSNPTLGQSIINKLNTSLLDAMGITTLSHKVLLTLHKDNFRSSSDIEIHYNM